MNVLQTMVDVIRLVLTQSEVIYVVVEMDGNWTTINKRVAVHLDGSWTAINNHVSVRNKNT